MKEGNPYTNLLKLMRTQGYNKDVSVAIGKVKYISPLEISLGNFTIKGEDMFIPQSLLEHKRKISVNADVTGTTTSADNHTHSLSKLIMDKVEITFHSPLEKDDDVLILIDGSDFYLIDKVVNEE